VDLIAKALDDEDSNVRVAAVDCLSELKDEPGREPLFRKALTDEHRRVRQGALITLSSYKLAFPGLLPEIVDLIDENPDVAAEALGRLGQGGAAALPWLHKILEGTEGRAEAAEAIWKISGDAAPLFTVVTESVERGEPQGIEELEEMGAAARPAVPDLANALAHDSRWIRIAAAKALGKIGGPEAKAALTARSAVEMEPKVLDAIRKATKELEGAVSD
jgi:HEAT repeat protein